ncbi:MAG: hypothetical protein KDJ38_05170 [Gammaproteobacteria bacterium]|nr:hypothetical protein [Gammaproteobacteria bacterium]
MHNRSAKPSLKQSMLVLAVLAGPSQAAVVDHPVFSVGGVVVVWGGNGAGNASVNDFIVSTPTGTVDLIAGDVQPVITGTLNNVSEVSSMLEVSGQTLNDEGVSGVLDAGDSFTAFAPSETINTTVDTIQSSFYVASNTGFEIRAQATLDSGNSDAGASLSDIYRTMIISKSGTDGGINYGVSAQYPHSGDSPISGVVNNGFLNNLATQRPVFQGDRATALISGNIASQSVRFTNTYELPSNVGFEAGAKQIAANVVYTIAIP